MSIRQQRGLEMAAKFKILEKSDGTWSVPSQTGKGDRYTIEMGDRLRWSCAYGETHYTKCKHIFAVECFQREHHKNRSESRLKRITLEKAVS